MGSNFYPQRSALVDVSDTFNFFFCARGRERGVFEAPGKGRVGF